MKELADKSFSLLKHNPAHPSLYFKRVGRFFFSGRVGRSHRALAVEAESDVVWFWIGTHAEYNRIAG